MNADGTDQQQAFVFDGEVGDEALGPELGFGERGMRTRITGIEFGEFAVLVAARDARGLQQAVGARALTTVATHHAARAAFAHRLPAGVVT